MECISEFESLGLGPVVEVQRAVREGKGEELARLLKDWPKFKSVAILASSGLPIVPAAIITEAGDLARANLTRTLERWGDRKVVIRTETKGGAAGGVSVQNCPVEEVWENVVPLIESGKMVMVMGKEGGDPYHNSYNVNVHLTGLTSAHLEIVGPGFTATDLNKRGLKHEEVKLSWGEEGFRAERVSRISDGQYRQNVESMFKRLEKKFGDKFLEKLQEMKATILEHRELYEPIDDEFLQVIYQLAPRIKSAVRAMGLEVEEAIVAMSFIQRKEGPTPVFWDIYGYGRYAASTREIETRAGSSKSDLLSILSEGRDRPKEGLKHLKSRQARREGD